MTIVVGDDPRFRLDGETVYAKIGDNEWVRVDLRIVDYKDLLRRYVAHIIARESHDYIDESADGWTEGPWTAEERAVLIAFSNEAQGKAPEGADES